MMSKDDAITVAGSTSVVQREPEQSQTMQLIAACVTGGGNVEALERLIALKAKEDAEQARRAYVVAMTAAKSQLPTTVDKTKAVSFSGTKYSHAELGDVCDVAVPILARHGITHDWEIDQPMAGQVRVTCVLTHIGGHEKRGATIVGPVDNSGSKNASQAIGSAITYYRRYTFECALGLAEHDQDDDGRGGQQKPQQQASTPPAPKREPATEPQLARLQSLANDLRLEQQFRYRINEELVRGSFSKEGSQKWIIAAKKKIEDSTGKPYVPWEESDEARAVNQHKDQLELVNDAKAYADAEPDEPPPFDVGAGDSPQLGDSE